METIYSILQSIGFDWQVALANLVNFLIIVWIIKKFAWKPIQEKLSERQSVITKGLEDAQNAEKSLQAAAEKSEKIVSDAKNESETIVTSAHDERKEILSKAEQDAADKKHDLHKEFLSQIEKYKKEEMKSFTGESIELFQTLAGKVLSEELNDEAKQAYALRAAKSLN